MSEIGTKHQENYSKSEFDTSLKDLADLYDHIKVCDSIPPKVSNPDGMLYRFYLIAKSKTLNEGSSDLFKSKEEIMEEIAKGSRGLQISTLIDAFRFIGSVEQSTHWTEYDDKTNVRTVKDIYANFTDYDKWACLKSAFMHKLAELESIQLLEPDEDRSNNIIVVKSCLNYLEKNKPQKIKKREIRK